MRLILNNKLDESIDIQYMDGYADFSDPNVNYILSLDLTTFSDNLTQYITDNINSLKILDDESNEVIALNNIIGKLTRYSISVDAAGFHGQIGITIYVAEPEE